MSAIPAEPAVDTEPALRTDPAVDTAAPTATPGPLAVLLGPPLSGKTTIAALLAKRTGTQALDADYAITQRAGKSIPEIFAVDGEPAFRALEAEVIAEALQAHRGVLALGGGAVVTATTRERLTEYRRRGGVVVLLEITAAEAGRRLSSPAMSERPLLGGPGDAHSAAATQHAVALDKWRALKRERQEWYDELATIKVNTGLHWPGQIASQILAQLPTAGRPEA